jgi:hypothetical protein
MPWKLGGDASPDTDIPIQPYRVRVRTKPADTIPFVLLLLVHNSAKMSVFYLS